MFEFVAVVFLALFIVQVVLTLMISQQLRRSQQQTKEALAGWKSTIAALNDANRMVKELRK